MKVYRDCLSTLHVSGRPRLIGTFFFYTGCFHIWCSLLGCEWFIFGMNNLIFYRRRGSCNHIWVLVLRVLRFLLLLSPSGSSDFVYFGDGDVLNVSATVRHRAGEDSRNVKYAHAHLAHML